MHELDDLALEACSGGALKARRRGSTSINVTVPKVELNLRGPLIGLPGGGTSRPGSGVPRAPSPGNCTPGGT